MWIRAMYFLSWGDASIVAGQEDIILEVAKELAQRATKGIQ